MGRSGHGAGAGSEGRPCPASEVCYSEGDQASDLVALEEHRGQVLEQVVPA
jgi:hypothetical protein